MSVTAVIVAGLFAIWCVVAIAICVSGWRAIHDGRSTEIDWEDGE